MKYERQVRGPLRLALYQFAPQLRRVPSNIERVAAAAERAQCDLLVTPELSITGYDVRDDVHALAAAFERGTRLSAIWGETAKPLAAIAPVLLGVVERFNEVPYNCALLSVSGVVEYKQRKVYLPTYGMFDEARYFGSGDRLETLELNGWRVGVLICEDFWHPGLAYVLASRGIDALMVMAAAPGRDVWNGGEEGAFFASSDSWERIARTTAQLYGIYVAVCNRCGVEGGVTFGGESIIVGPGAEVIARAGIDEALITVDLSEAELARARRPYAHIRDDDAHFIVRELTRELA